MHVSLALKAFRQRSEGTIAMMFALSLMVFLLAAGTAIDYARAYNVESSMQADLDAAILGAATGFADAEQLAANAERYFNANWKDRDLVSGLTIQVTQTGQRTLAGTATAQVPTTVLHIAGRESLTVTASTEVEITTQDVEAMLVLDTTASMAGSKLASLQEASKTLIETAYQSPDAAQHVRIGIVPFSQYVNVGMGNRNASWIDVPPDSSTPRQSCGDTYPNATSSNCRLETFTASNDGVPYTYQSQVCDWNYGDPVYQCTDYNEITAWYGCVGSRNTPLDVEDGQYETRVPGLMNISCGSPITPLTNTVATLESQIDAFVATGETYIPAGVLWGWAALSKQAPFEEARGYGERVGGAPVRKIMVIMTDGANTKSPTYPSHDGSDAVLANEKTTQLCTSVRRAGVDVYTVAFEVMDEAIKDILRACASSPSKFYDAPTAEQLEDAFHEIGASFAPLRITG